VVDGESEDSTLKIVDSVLKNTGIIYKVMSNPGRTLASGWNLGIRNSKGTYIIRPDAHAMLQTGYINGALEMLKSIPEAGVVGGRLETKAKSGVGKIILEALSMKTGVGNSSFRTNENSGFKDTAVYGLYRKEVFDKVGLFNEKLIKHQDTEFHSRMIEAGFGIYMNSSIIAVYYCRDSFKGLFMQMFIIGYYFSLLMEEKAGSSLRLRHWVPMLFYLFLFFTGIIGLLFEPVRVIFYTFTTMYLASILIECVYRFLVYKGINTLTAFFVVPLMHFCYAAGTFTGIIKWLTNR
jgi:GT2 family glycosyltransferase